MDATCCRRTGRAKSFVISIDITAQSTSSMRPNSADDLRMAQRAVTALEHKLVKSTERVWPGQVLQDAFGFAL